VIKRHICLGVVLLLASGTGCGTGRPARVVAPRLDPTAVTTAMFAVADADGNGMLDGGELAAVPGVKAAEAVFDADGDRAVSRQEILLWLEEVRRSKVAITACETQILRRGRPVANAVVKFVPETFMGGGMKTAVGTTDADGIAQVTIPDALYPGVNCGIYRVEITGQERGGRAFPTQYNSASRLGIAVGGRLPENGTVTFDLKDE